jgi:hypothetical protein
MKNPKEERLIAIRNFCRIVNNYEGELTIRDGKAYNVRNELIYEFRLL